MNWIKSNVYALGAALLAVGLLVGWHYIAVSRAKSAGDAAGYARAQAEDRLALADRIKLDADLRAKDRATTEGLLHDLHIIQAAHRADLADAIGEFSVIRVLAYPTAGSSGAAADPGRTAGGVDGASDDQRSGLPSLAVAGQELSNCELEGDRFAALQQWVRNRRAIEVSPIP